MRHDPHIYTSKFATLFLGCADRISVLFVRTAARKEIDMENEYAKDKEVIEDLISRYYHEGHAAHNGELYKPILHGEWKLFYVDPEGKMGVIDRDAYIASYDPAQRDDSLNWKTEICYIDVDGRLASVKLRIYNQNFGYTDYFNLLKLEDGRWYIVHKISQPLAQS